MDVNNLSKFELANIKRTAASTKMFIAKRNLLVKKATEINTKIDALDDIINKYEAPIKEFTGGFTAEDVTSFYLARKAANGPKTIQEFLGINLSTPVADADLSSKANESSSTQETSDVEVNTSDSNSSFSFDN